MYLLNKWINYEVSQYSNPKFKESYFIFMVILN